MSTPDPPVLYHREGPVATLTLNRPQALNAFDEPTILLLDRELERAAGDPEARVVAIRGSGRAFCAGGDLGAIRSASSGALASSLGDLAAIFHRAVRTIRDMPKPVVAVLNGVAAGGGLSLALACDLRFLTASGFLQQAYTSNGLCPDGGGTYFLPRLVGWSRAFEMVLLDPRLPAEEALRIGLVHAVYPDQEFPARVDEQLAALAAKPVGALARAKRLLNTSFDASLAQRLDEEQEGIVEQAAGPEGQEGIAAFLEKRRPSYT